MLLQQLAENLGLELQGPGDIEISRVATLTSASADSLSFLANPALRSQLKSCQAAAVILPKDTAAEIDFQGSRLLANDPYLAYAKAAQLLYPRHNVAGIRHPSAVIANSAQIHPTASIEAQCVIGENVQIGPNVRLGPGCILAEDVIIHAHTELYARVTVYPHTRLGERCLIHAGVVLGSDGFGLANEQGKWVKIPQVGGLHIGDDVEIGANTCIDCGAIEPTVIENGVKLDNQIHIAHNVTIGEHTAMAACVGVAGSAKIGPRCMIAGGAGILGHLAIVEGVTITAMSLVTRSIKNPGVYSSSLPVQENRDWQRNHSRLRHLDELMRRFLRLEKRIEQQTNK